MYISVDMGGTNTRVAGAIDLVDFDLVNQPTKQRNSGDYERDLDFIVNSAKKIAGRTAITALGIGTPGTPNLDRTRISSAINIPHWNNQPLVEPISNALDCEVYYGNDGEAGALGHAYYGSPDALDFHYLIWGTGIGGAEIEFDFDGDIVHLGKLHWESHFKEWEAAVSGSSLTERFGEPPENFTPERWLKVIHEFGKHLDTYVQKYDPKRIVFGGGLAEKHASSLIMQGINRGVDVSINGDTIYGGFGLVRFGQTHGLPPIDASDIED